MAPQREWFEKDYYKVLGVAEGATQKEITRAYRKLAKENHPDANPGAEDRFKEISAGYDVLGDADKRKEYDEVRAPGPAAAGFGGGGAGGGGGFRVEDLGDFGDIFGNLFGRGGGRTRHGLAGAPGPQRGADLEAELHLSFDDAVARRHHHREPHQRGRAAPSAAAPAPRRAPCRSRARPATAPASRPTTRACSASRRRAPPAAGGVASSSSPCANCAGTGVERRPRTVKVRIPAGVQEGQRSG